MEIKYLLWQVKIWDLFAKTIPFIITISVGIFYYLGYRDWNLIYSTSAIFLVTVAVTWWFWVIYSIASIAILINNSGKSLEEIIKEIKSIKEAIAKEKNNL